jgi:hypothetical protein
MTAGVILTADQANAVRSICDWFSDPWRSQQTFFLSGYAGVGKSTVVGHVIDRLGLDDSDVCFGCYTMKAALVLRRLGMPASTIHRMIYTPIPPSREAFEAAQEELAALREAGPRDLPSALYPRPHPRPRRASRRPCAGPLCRQCRSRGASAQLPADRPRRSFNGR